MQEIKLSKNAFKCNPCSTHLSDPSLMSLSRAAAAGGGCDFCKSSCCIFSSAALCSVYTLYIVVGLVLHILPNAKHGVHSSSRHCSTTDNRNKKARVGRISPPSIHRVALHSSQSFSVSYTFRQERKLIWPVKKRQMPRNQCMECAVVGFCHRAVAYSCNSGSVWF